MGDKITYYAMFDVHSSRARPRTVFRRVDHPDGHVDELFSHDLAWKSSPLLHASERGDTMFDFAEISEEEAEGIVARIRAAAADEG